jgi:hypothetical protein
MTRSIGDDVPGLFADGGKHQGQSKSKPPSATTPLNAINDTECCPKYRMAAADQVAMENAAMRFILRVR